jgi:lipoprotein-anchoring transpeptidase ErfK/SrfK
MRGGVITLAGAAAIAAGAATLAFSSSKPEVAAAEVSRPVSSDAPSSATDRVLLTKAQLDQAIAAGTFDRPVKSLLRVRAPLHFGDYLWDDRSVPAGPTWVRVDLRSQLISVFRAEHEIGTAVIVFGADGLPTPAGKFPILAKLKNHRSESYDAPMPYTLRLTTDGVSIHASSVRWGAATHGCIGVPLPFAERLFNAAKVGDEVVVVGSPPRSRTS